MASSKKHDTGERETYADKVAAKVIEQLERGTAPWQKPWNPGALQSSMPMNPTTGKAYRGANSLWLTMQGRDDPRWMTYNQADAVGAQVRKGQRGTSIQYVKLFDEVPRRDATGAIVKDADGKAVKDTVKLERPRIFCAVVFNAEQIDGLPALAPAAAREPWEVHRDAEAIIANAGVPINHVPGNRAYYSPGADRITLPEREQFPSADNYYATALHELGHATGHPSRLGRDLSNPFGSEGYAREELRAEIASLMVGQRLGTGHDPEQHVAYVGDWIKALKEDPREIFRAAADAEKITHFLMALVDQQEVTRDQRDLTGDDLALATSSTINDEGSSMKLTQRQDLTVAYKDKDQAKAAGAKWDKDAKTWFAPAGADSEKIAPWLPKDGGSAQQLSPREEFAEALRDAGLILKDAPIMDGTRQRVPVDGSKGGERPGSYIGHLDGWPAGTIENFKTGLKTSWKASGVAPKLTDVDRQRLRTETDQKLAQREHEKEQRHIGAVKALETFFAIAPATTDHPYLSNKGLSGTPIRVVPAFARDLEGVTYGAHTYFDDKNSGPRRPALAGNSIEDEGTQIRIAKDLNHAKELRAAEPDSIVLTAGDAIIPIFDCDYNLRGAQTISPKGFKSMVAGTNLAGGMFRFDSYSEGKGPDSPIVVVEGYATASTIHKAIDATVVVAFNAGNLKAVGESLRYQEPDRPILFAGDNDQAKAREIDEATGLNKPNTGVEKATEAAAAVGGYAAFPQFADPKSKGSDWNDLHKEEGLAELEKQLTVALLLADRRKLEDAHRLGHGAESVSQDIVQHQADAELVADAAQGQAVVGALGGDAKSMAATLRNAAEVVADQQDKSDEIGNGQEHLAAVAESLEGAEEAPAKQKKRSGGRKR